MFINTIKSYECTTCDISLHLSECEYDDYEGQYVCPFCGNRHVTVSHERPAEWFGVAIYEISRAYGGPEEGGWYFDAGQRIDETVRTYRNTPEGREEAKKYLDSLLALNFVSDRYSETRYHWDVSPEALPDDYFPRRRPVYC
jgi:predicted RNA-binding Zn-ribbon protein involved in translation (DUF1610 family)